MTFRTYLPIATAAIAGAVFSVAYEATARPDAPPAKHAAAPAR